MGDDQTQAIDPMGLVEFFEVQHREMDNDWPELHRAILNSLARGLAGEVGTPATVGRWLLSLAPVGLGTASFEVASLTTPNAIRLAKREGPRGIIGVVSLAFAMDGREANVWPVIFFRTTDRRVPTCRVCGCTKHVGCPRGCKFVRSDLCSTCISASELATLRN
jgi:hypothetical protein